VAAPTGISEPLINLINLTKQFFYDFLGLTNPHNKIMQNQSNRLNQVKSMVQTNYDTVEDACGR